MGEEANEKAWLFPDECLSTDGETGAREVLRCFAMDGSFGPYCIYCYQWVVFSKTIKETLYRRDALTTDCLAVTLALFAIAIDIFHDHADGLCGSVRGVVKSGGYAWT